MLEGFLLKELFSVAGFKVTPKAILIGIVVILVAVAIFFSVRAYRAHEKYISDLVQANAQLTKDNGTLTAQKTQLLAQNAANAATLSAIQQSVAANEKIATDEQAASTKRADTYKEIHHAIDTAPHDSTPVAPVISGALDGLWGPAPGNGQ